MDPVEWNTFEGDGARRFEQRLSQQLGRSDIRVLRLLHVDKQSRPLRGLSFADFKKAYMPPTLYFSCACCPDGQSSSVLELPVEEFRNSGGLVTVLGGLAL